MLTIGKLDLDNKLGGCYILAKQQMRILNLEEPETLAEVQGLIISGRSAEKYRLFLSDAVWAENLQQVFSRRMPIFGLGYGLLLLSEQIGGENGLGQKGLNITVTAEFGREARAETGEVLIPAYGGKPLAGIGYANLRIAEVGPNVGILGWDRGEAVLVRQGNYLGASFYTDIQQNLEIYDYFFRMVSDYRRYK